MYVLLVIYLGISLVLSHRIIFSPIWKCHRQSLDGLKIIYTSLILCVVFSFFVLGSLVNYNFSREDARLLVKSLLVLCIMSALIQLQVVGILNKRRVDYPQSGE